MMEEKDQQNCETLSKYRENRSSFFRYRKKDKECTSADWAYCIDELNN